MPLSDREEQLFAELERQLHAEDPRLVERAQRRVAWGGAGRRRIMLAIVGIVVGLLGILSLSWHIGWGIVGFILLVGSTTVLVQALMERSRTPRGD